MLRAQKKEDPSLLTFGKEILEGEIAAIQGVIKLVDEQFTSTVNEICSIPNGGRIITTGMGKAGIIAQKISATFASIGVSSFFLHPSEAIHGDLGRVSDNDLVLIFSNSGETDEIVRILPSFKEVGIPVISITASRSSTIGKYSDLILELGEIKEVGPHGIAPTATTTAMLALGDALAMTVFSKLGYSQERFAAYHPGGAIGRSLMTVQEIMRQGNEVCIVRDILSSREVLQHISSTPGRPGAAAITDREGVLVGVFTDGDLRRCLKENSSFLDQPISTVMGRSPKTVTGHKLVTEALQILTQYKIDQVIVVNDYKQPIGIIDIQDLVQFRRDSLT